MNVCVICGEPVRAGSKSEVCSDGCARERQRLAMERFRRARGVLPKNSRTNRQRISMAKKALWAAGGARYKDRTCRGCERPFTPVVPQQRYCSKECRLISPYARKHGLSTPAFLALLEKQGGKCAICRGGRRGWGAAIGKWALVVDHDHKTGRVRGLLCSDCNSAIGRFSDNPVRLRAAAQYLEQA